MEVVTWKEGGVKRQRWVEVGDDAFSSVNLGSALFADTKKKEENIIIHWE